jgi:glycosyltransferase involved in cell wall biosynthesis
MRMLQFIPQLEAAGATVIVEPFFGNSYLRNYFSSGSKSALNTLLSFARRIFALRKLWRADLVWIEKELFPFIPGVAERIAGLGGAPYVVDYDDAIFHNYELLSNRGARTLLANKLDALLKGASCVTAGNQYLADYAEAHGAPRILIVPTVVDIERYALRPAPDQARLRIGWIGTPRNASYLEPVIAALDRLLGLIPHCLVTIGAPRLDRLGARQERHDWSEDTEAELLAGVDIGVMPLPDEPFERGKCGYKLIQYMAAGRPVVASPVGVNHAIVSPDVGFLAETEDEWASAIETLARDPALRARIGAAGRHKVERCYSLQAVGPQLVSLFAELTATRGRASRPVR